MEQDPARLPRTSLNGSALVGLLTQWALVDRPLPAPPSLVEGLGAWLGWKEAIPLQAALQAVAKPAARPPHAAPLQDIHAAALQMYTRKRLALERSISSDASLASEDGHSFLPFRRRCHTLQQAMENGATSLREQLRAQVAVKSPALAQLAALDAVMASALAHREQSLLGLMPVFLEKHFQGLRLVAQATTTTSHPPQPVARGPAPWLLGFRGDMKHLLLAELDLRLQPAQGLLDALQAACPAQLPRDAPH